MSPTTSSTGAATEPAWSRTGSGLGRAASPCVRAIGPGESSAQPSACGGNPGGDQVAGRELAISRSYGAALEQVCRARPLRSFQLLGAEPQGAPADRNARRAVCRSDGGPGIATRIRRRTDTRLARELPPLPTPGPVETIERARGSKSRVLSRRPCRLSATCSSNNGRAQPRTTPAESSILRDKNSRTNMEGAHGEPETGNDA